MRLPFPEHRAPIAAGVLLAVVFGACAWLASEYKSRSAWVSHTRDVRDSFSRLMSLVRDAEASQRGYLLARDKAFLDRYHVAVAELPGVMESLKGETADNSEQQARLAALTPVVELRLAILREIVDQFDAGHPIDGARLERGRELMESLRSQIEELQAAEDRLLAERVARSGAATTALFAAAVLAALLSISIVLMWSRSQESARRQLNEKNLALVQALADRDAGEAKVRQMQKMEAVGQLTGGIAHDFNNMLGVVIGALNLAQKRLAKGDGDVAPLIDGALDGANRAASLTKRLLAFSRQQPLSPRPVNANALISGMSELVARTLGETIQTEAVLAAGLWSIHADRSLLENAILNLCVNARDAMPEGGKLTLETANTFIDEAYARSNEDILPGQYVMIAVSDTGTGMTAEVMAKAFDPFFSTKGPGKGTGLGLSQVHGFVKQSAGHIKIYSELGTGTTIKIYFPRQSTGAEQLHAGPAPKPSAQQIADGPAGQLVLVVEDDPRVRETSVAMLNELGYATLASDGAADALRQLDASPDVALLFTDIVMPETNGRKLADEALKRRPDLKVLFTTGFTRNAIVHSGVVDAGVDLIQKPFTLDHLAAKVAQALAR